MCCMCCDSFSYSLTLFHEIFPLPYPCPLSLWCELISLYNPLVFWHMMGHSSPCTFPAPDRESALSLRTPSFC